jgi:hypothetical protein
LDQIQIASGVSDFDAETISIKMRRDSCLLKQIFGALTASSFTASPEVAERPLFRIQPWPS